MTAMVLPTPLSSYGNISNAQTIPQKHTGKLETLQDKIETTSRKAEELKLKGQEIRTEISSLQKKLVTLAAEIQQREALASEIEQRITVLTQQRVVLQRQLDGRHEQMSKALGAMQKLSLQPAAYVFLKPDRAVSSLHTRTALNRILPSLRAEATAITEDMEKLRAVKAQITAEQDDLHDELLELASSKQEMAHMVENRQQKYQQLMDASRAERQRLARYAREAKSLRELITRLEQENRRREKAARDAARRLAAKPQLGKTPQQQKPSDIALPQGSSPFSTARGTLPLPASGRLVRAFGQNTPSGQKAKGITLRTRQSAQVVAPYDGRIVFAGPFRTYGQLLIIAHGEGYHTLLAGLDQVYGVVGQWVLKGEPIAQMGINVKDQGGGPYAGAPQLYVELRRRGKPINPLPWLAARDRKVLG